MVRDIRGNVLADRAVAARRRQHQHATLVAERTAEPVDLGLGGHRHGRIRRQVEETLHPRHELFDLFDRERILQAEHRPRMGDLGEARRGRRRAEPLRRRIRAHQLREALLQLAVLADQGVIIRVGNLRRVLVVIKLVVASNLLRQPHQAIGGVGLAQLSGHARRTTPPAG